MTTRKHVFYGILALISLLGLGMTHSARASATYTFSGTLSGRVDDYGGNWPPIPVIASFQNDPFTGSAFYNSGMNEIGFSIQTVDGYFWGAGWIASDPYSVNFTLNPFTLSFPGGTAGSDYTFGELNFELSGFTYWGNTAGGHVEDTTGTITSYSAVPDAGNTATLLGIGLVAIMVSQRKRRGRSYF